MPIKFFPEQVRKQGRLLLPEQRWISAALAGVVFLQVFCKLVGSHEPGAAKSQECRETTLKIAFSKLEIKIDGCPESTGIFSHDCLSIIGAFL